MRCGSISSVPNFQQMCILSFRATLLRATRSVLAGRPIPGVCKHLAMHLIAKKETLPMTEERERSAILIQFQYTSNRTVSCLISNQAPGTNEPIFERQCSYSPDEPIKAWPSRNSVEFAAEFTSGLAAGFTGLLLILKICWRSWRSKQPFCDYLGHIVVAWFRIVLSFVRIPSVAGVPESIEMCFK